MLKEKTLTNNLINYGKMNNEELYRSLRTNIEGISTNEAKERIEKYGHNEVAHEKAKPWYVKLIMSFINPFNLVLITLAIVSTFTDVILASKEDRSFMTVSIILIMVTISAVLQFIQEGKSEEATSKLKAMVKTTVAVKRENKEIEEIDMIEIVPGDIVHLSAGDMIPADMRVISCKDLFVSQSSLTGESEPVEKFATLSDRDRGISISDLDNILLLGTTIISGSAIGVVLSTGNETYFGNIATEIVNKKEVTSFEKGVSKVSLLLIRFMMVMVPIVFVINGITKGDWLQAFLFAISIAVGLTPEMLPMIVTTNLAKGAIAMAKKKTVVKKLDAIQNFGAMDILCTDKTGTLTLDKIVVERHLNINGEEDLRVLRHAYLNSYYQTGFKNLMDIAILDFGKNLGCDKDIKLYEKVDEIPFDFSRRRMSVVLRKEDGKRQLVTKGAVEEMLNVCSYAEVNGEVVDLTEEVKEKVLAMVVKLNTEGMRVIGVAQKNEIPDEYSFGVKDERDMVLMGYVAFLDPPKESAKEALRALKESGVEVKILTGDNDAVTKKVCSEVGIEVREILLGGNVDTMTDEELALVVEEVNVFAKLSPLQKSRIIKILQEKGHVVGFMGDGINDAAALKESDVGISVDTAVDIAKESADIILLEKSLMVLEEGVLEGRRVFGNIVKYIKMTASSNFGNVFSVLIASAFLPFMPMLPIQLLVQNLLYDFSQLSIPWDSMDKEYLDKPRKWDPKDIGRFMLCVGPISSIFDIMTFGVMWFIFGANSIGSQGLFQTGWFVMGLLSQTLVVHMIRTEKVPFLQSRANKPVIILTSLIMIIALAMPFSTFGRYLGFTALPGIYFLLLAGLLLGYCVSIQVVKGIYMKKFKSWL
ncbi:magnesium-translocating P-type ATPase [Clostridium paraputrificum]|uniref:magnesium-translocating P-type ATPase n=1 Tax=Clostridium paraputrificum TaxID=29363 RepID=UPI003D335352